MTSVVQNSLIERSYFASPIEQFLVTDDESVLGRLTHRSEFDVGQTQRDAWLVELKVFREALSPFGGRGTLYIEFVVPRLGKRIDAVVLIDHVLFVVEFKVGDRQFVRHAIDQVWDYALDLKNFHESSHALQIEPILVITGRNRALERVKQSQHTDGVGSPTLASSDQLGQALKDLLSGTQAERIHALDWERGRYRPTPTIVEAASALYRRHSVAEIARSDAGAKNLAKTSAAVARVIEQSRAHGRKAICLVTGVPGAGKTLVGLDIATRYLDRDSDLHSVYLSGNGPLVDILREALARDDVAQSLARGARRRKGEARQAVKTFIQPIHAFRDECLKDLSPPDEHVTIFDEAQRAWNLQKTADFMKRKKGRPGFAMSEPAFLISCLDRHGDWAVVVCLIGGGQEINTGEAGISEWLQALEKQYPAWEVHVSPQLSDAEYAAGDSLKALEAAKRIRFNEDLHLAVSMRSFRAEHLSTFVKRVLDLELDLAAQVYSDFQVRISAHRGRRFSLMVDGISARSWTAFQSDRGRCFSVIVDDGVARR